MKNPELGLSDFNLLITGLIQYWIEKNNSAHFVQKTQYVHEMICLLMKTTVKARVHYGADSLDLTIPVEIIRKYDIEAGDVFELTIEEKRTNDETVLSYRRVYSTKKG